MVNRRSFLKGLSLAPAAPLVKWVPEKAKLTRWHNTAQGVVDFTVHWGKGAFHDLGTFFFKNGRYSRKP